MPLCARALRSSGGSEAVSDHAHGAVAAVARRARDEGLDGEARAQSRHLGSEEEGVAEGGTEICETDLGHGAGLRVACPGWLAIAVVLAVVFFVLASGDLSWT